MSYDEEDNRRLKEELGMVHPQREPPSEKKVFRGRLTGRDALNVLTAGRALVGLRKIRPSEEDVIISNTGVTKKKWEYALFALHLNEDGCLAIAPHMIEAAFPADGKIQGMADLFADQQLVPISSHRFGVAKRLTIMLSAIGGISNATVFEFYLWTRPPTGFTSDNMERVLYRKALAPTVLNQLVIQEELRTEYFAKNLASVQGGYPDVLWMAVRMSGGTNNIGYEYKVMFHSDSRVGDSSQAQVSPPPSVYL